MPSAKGHRKLDISKTITARSFKHGQLIKKMQRLPGEIKKKSIVFFSSFPLFIFSSYRRLQIWTSKTCNKFISKSITASSLRFGQLKRMVSGLPCEKDGRQAYGWRHSFS